MLFHRGCTTRLTFTKRTSIPKLIISLTYFSQPTDLSTLSKQFDLHKVDKCFQISKGHKLAKNGSFGGHHTTRGFLFVYLFISQPHHKLANEQHSALKDS